MGAVNRKNDKDEEVFNIKRREKRSRRAFFGPGARTRWVTERIASMKIMSIE